MTQLQTIEKTSTSQPAEALRTRRTFDQVLDALDTSRTCRALLGVLWTLEKSENCEGVKPTLRASKVKASDLVYPDTGEVPKAVAEFSTSRTAREAVCEALTFVEDWFEYQQLDWQEAKPRDKRSFDAFQADRMRLRTIRRRLEQELFP